MELLRITDKLEMQFYCAECIRSNWNVRELHRQIESALFQRIALSRDRKGVLELARKGNEVRRPEDIYRDSYVLEFSGIPARSRDMCRCISRRRPRMASAVVRAAYGFDGDSAGTRDACPYRRFGDVGARRPTGVIMLFTNAANVGIILCLFRRR